MTEIIKEIIQPGKGNVDEIYDFITRMDNYFDPSHSSMANLLEYATKITRKATLFTVRDNGRLIGLDAIYFDPKPKLSFGTYLCVEDTYQRDFLIGPELIMDGINYCKEKESGGVWCSISKTNRPLYNFYTKLGFIIMNEKKFPNSEISQIYMVKYF